MIPVTQEFIYGESLWAISTEKQGGVIAYTDDIETAHSIQEAINVRTGTKGDDEPEALVHSATRTNIDDLNESVKNRGVVKVYQQLGAATIYILRPW